MSFFRHQEIFRSDAGSNLEGELVKAGSPTIVSMSLRLAIPWRVALQQMLRDQEVGGSNPLAPTIIQT
jgi:hypothetical protein